MTNNERGLLFEKKCFDKLVEIGFINLRLTNNTDNGADIIGSYKGTIYVFQCKNHLKMQGNKCVQEVLAARLLYKGNRSVVISNSDFTKAAFALAKANNCILITAAEFFKLSDFPPLNYTKILKEQENYYDFDYDIIEKYNKAKNIIGRTPKLEELDKHLRYEINKKYKNYGNFLKIIGDKLYLRKISDDEIKKEYLRVKMLIGKIPTLSDMRKNSSFALNLFHTYPFTKLQKECGDRPHIERGVSKEVLIKSYFSLKEKLGKVPTVKEIDTLGEYKASYYRRRWGSFNAFLFDIGSTRVKAGLPKVYNKDEIIFLYSFIKIIFSIIKEDNNVQINHTVLERLLYNNKCLISPSTISNKFGSWQKFKNILDEKNIDNTIIKIVEKIKTNDFSIFEKLID